MDAPLRSFPPDSTPQQASHNLRHMVDEIDTFLRSAADTGDHKFDAVRERLSMQVRQMRQQIEKSGRMNEVISMIRDAKVSDRIIGQAKVAEIAAEDWNKLVEARAKA